MTRTDLVKRLVQAAGAPESQGRTLMESFLSRLDSLLPNSSAAFVVNGLGTFRKSADETIVSPEEINIEFHPAPQHGTEVLYFDLPRSVVVVDELDKYFSPSLGKPIIPLKIEQSYEDYLYFAGTGLEQIVDTKVEKLIKAGHLTEDDIDWSPPKLPVQEASFQWTTESSAFQEEFNKKKSEPVEQPRTEKPFNPRLTQETILPQEQQKGWKDELVEDEILNTGYEATPKTPVMEIEDDITWDFGDLVPAEEKDPKLKKEREKAERQARANLAAEQRAEQRAEQIEENKKKTGIDLLPMPGESTKEFSIDLSEFDDDGAIEEQETNPLDDAEIEDFDMFFKKSLARNVMDTISFEQHESDAISKDEVNPFPEELDPGADEIDLEEEEEEYNPDLPEVRAHKLTGFKKGDEEDEDQPGYQIPSRPKVPEKAGWGKYSLAASFFTVFGLASYIYMYGFPQWVKDYAGELMFEKKRVVPTVIERDYLFPVSYPYEKTDVNGEEIKVPAATVPSKENNKENSNNEPAAKKTDPPVDMAKNNPAVPPANAVINNPITEALKKQTPKQVKEELKTTKETNKPVKENSKQLKSNIFQDGNKYTVQVMSSPKQTDSEREVARLKAKGYSAYLAEADIPGKGKYFRVRVGGFNSLEEAERFASSVK